MSKVKSYIKEVLARFKGDKEEVVAQQNHRLACAAVKGQISALEGKLVEDEQAVIAAKERLDEVTYPTKRIIDMTTYVQNLREYQLEVEDAEAALNSTKESLEFFQSKLAEFETEVEA